ncbi:hypothetical protein N7539_008414 [Penicillium diatomitis]|uniref:Secreted protein n=1 Tax=Penicillium diatomitis TaxID=2819901 RepID=A0A9X0BNG2_9EURO|nr:uncharacterized protein N7539_008414 [Penicillium diatomitis]KAJ5475348.1 hypothetical protein N7539_008414 [Penicillium diatomitis]
MASTLDVRFLAHLALATFTWFTSLDSWDLGSRRNPPSTDKATESVLCTLPAKGRNLSSLCLGWTGKAKNTGEAYLEDEGPFLANDIPTTGVVDSGPAQSAEFTA